MRSLDHSTRDWLLLLLERRRQASALLPRPGLARDTLALLDTAPPLRGAALPYLVPLLSFPDPETARKAATLATELILQQNIDGLARVANDFRAVLSAQRSWNASLESRLLDQGFTLKAFDRAEQLLRPALASSSMAGQALCLFTLSANGYLREAALRRLATGYIGAWLPFAILRLADWVPQIQQLAQQLLNRHLVPEHLSSYLRCSGLLQKLNPRAAAAAAALSEAVRALALALPGVDGLVEVLRGGSAERQVFVLELIAQHPSGGRAKALSIALRSKLVKVQRWAVRLLNPDHAEEMRLALDGLGWLRDPGALRELIDKLPPEAWEKSRTQLEALSMHRRPAIQASAVFYLKQRLEADCGPRFRAALEGRDERLYAPALRGLAAARIPMEAGLLLRLIRHPSPEVRCAVVMLGRQHDEEVRQTLLSSALADPSHKVARAALSSPEHLGAGILIESLQKLVHQPPAGSFWPGRLLQALSKVNEFKRFELLLWAIALDPAQRLPLLEGLSAAGGYRSRQPTEAERQSVELALAAAETHLPQESVGLIRQYLS